MLSLSFVILERKVILWLKHERQQKKILFKVLKKGNTVSELVLTTGILKSTINDWLRDTRIDIESDDLKTLKKKYYKLVDEHVDFYNDFRPHHHLNGQTPNMYESKYILKNGLTPQLSEQSSLFSEIKKTFSSGQFNQKGSKVLL